MTYEISYGKGHISLYRTYATPLDDLTPIPESSYRGQANQLFATDVHVEVFGEAFLDAYTEGDNANVVATATITNFVLQRARLYNGATQEGFLHYIGRELLHEYPQMEMVRVSAEELPFAAAAITDDSGETVTPSKRLFMPTHDSYGFASLDLEREADGEVVVTDHECGRLDMKLVKLTGSAFAEFMRDEYTTLPERDDRLLYIFLDAGWRYGDVADAIGADHSRYIAAQQVYDLIQHVFDDFVSMSIQHLVYEMGVRLLRRFPQMEAVWFTAQNRLWETAAESEGEKAKVFMDPRPPYGEIKLMLTRDELDAE